jgi:alpha-glucosidase
MLHPPIAPWAVPCAEGLRLRLLGDPGQAHDSPVFVRSLPDNEELLTAMQPAGMQAGRPCWRALVPWDGGNPLTLYCFVLASPQGHRWLGADGEHALVPPEALHFRQHPQQAPPAWVRDQVFYQVFPDRFARARGATAEPHHVPWGTPPDPARGASAFYGGSLDGLCERLPYLHDELGVTALYLNPVFASPSNHRYDTSDYTRVDPALGGNAALLALREATRQRGMRLVLDAVVNHTGAEHHWFRQAIASPAAPSRSHYAFDDGGRPVGWKGHASLPVLDFASPALQQAIYGAHDAVLRRWLQPPWAIDGWRLDVIHMLGEGAGAANNAHHARAIRRAIREENPEAYVLGEHFAEATRWLQGDAEDGAMNYWGFMQPLRAWLAGAEVGGMRARIDGAAFAAALARAVASVPYANQLAQFNLLGSHDTTRLLTELQGDAALMHLAFTLLFTRPGVPCLYYGDEIGTEGGADPDCRRCFDWDRRRWNGALFEHVRALARLRQARREWRDGAVLALGCGDDWLAFARFDDKAATVVALNRGAAIDVRLPLHQVPLDVAQWLDARGRVVAGAGRSATAGAMSTLTLPAAGSVLLLSA